MRTPEQISNLRQVLVGMIGPLGLAITDEDVDNWANRFQREVNKLSEKSTWSIKIRFKEDGKKKWEKISPEPKTPYASLGMMTSKCYELLDKHEDILEIKINDPKGISYIFNRDYLQTF